MNGRHGPFISTKCAAVLFIGTLLLTVYLSFLKWGVPSKEYNVKAMTRKVKPVNWTRVFDFVPKGLTNCKHFKAENAPNDMKMENDMDGELKPVDLRRVFDFVPYGITNCKDLFAGIKPNKSIENFFPSQHVNLVHLHGKKYASLTKHGEGCSAEFLEQTMVYWKLVQAPFVRTVCETGFNGGHSALLWLSANPNTHVYSFDIGVHSYARHMAEFIQNIFPGRLTVTWGSSVKTLPLFHANNPDVLCDLIVIDGGHTRAIARSDMSNFRIISAKQNILVLDDYPSPAWNFDRTLGPVWEEAKQTGEISELFRCSYLNAGKNAHGFSVGRFNF